MTTDALHILVSGAIWRAEQLEEQRLSAATTAWAEVSQLEEQLASTLPLSQPEGRIARRGAVRAALKARDYTRAEALVERFSREPRAPRALRTALRQMLEEDAEALASHFSIRPCI